MQTLSLTIPGEYYDSQLYSGRLYLWTRDESIVTLDWHPLIEAIPVPESLRFALRCSFQHSEYLYNFQGQTMLHDPDIRTLLTSKFHQLSQLRIEMSPEFLKRFTIREQRNPFPFPHADNLAFYNNLFVASQDGIARAVIDRRNRNPVSRVVRQLWDGPVSSLAGAHSTVAFSCGDDGLFQLRWNPVTGTRNRRDTSPVRVLDQHSDFVRWMYASIFSSSYSAGGYLLDYDWRDLPSLRDDQVTSDRTLLGVFSTGDIFDQKDDGQGTFSWGGHDKLYRMTNKAVEIVRYDPQYNRQLLRPLLATSHDPVIFSSVEDVRRLGLEGRYTRLGSVGIDSAVDDIVQADTAAFGVVIEGSEGVVVIGSDQEVLSLEGEPVNWRIFPRSVHYTNQLHLIYENYLTVYSFVHDFLVDQSTKRIGLRSNERELLGGRS